MAARTSGATTEEARCLDAAAQLHPADGASLDARACKLLYQRRQTDAIELAALTAQLEPHSALAHFRAGYALPIADRHADALAPSRRALAPNPALPQLRNSLASALTLSGGDLDEQLALLESALRDTPREE